MPALTTEVNFELIVEESVGRRTGELVRVFKDIEAGLNRFGELSFLFGEEDRFGLP
jgi:hypothetical protein